MLHRPRPEQVLKGTLVSLNSFLNRTKLNNPKEMIRQNSLYPSLRAQQ